MKRAALLVVLTGLLMGGLVPARASDKPIMVVIGDSISATSDVPHAEGGYIYNDKPRSSRQAWWSYLRRDIGYRVRVFAEGGSGYHRAGRGCKLTTFAQRVQLPAVQKQLKVAKLVIIEGGVNDWMTCGTATLPAEIDTTMRVVQEAAPEARLMVIAPWGTAKGIQGHKEATVSAIRSAAKRHGFTYVSTRLSDSRTRDRIHPNRKGIIYIADKVRAAR